MRIDSSPSFLFTLTVSSVACLLMSCSGNDPTGDPTDETADAATDVGADTTGTTADTGPARCEDAPTARISATPRSSKKEVRGVQTGTIEVTPLTDLILGADKSIAHENRSIGRVKWEIEDRPEYALATFGFRRLRDVERPLFLETNDPAPVLQVGLAGDYTIGLTVWNEQGTVSCNTAELTVEVRPSAELYVEFKYPYQQVENENGQTLFEHGEAQLDFYFKRFKDSEWFESLNNTIPNSRTDTDVQDWGEPNNEDDDPQYEEIRGIHGNGFIQLDGVPEGIVYELATALSGDVSEETPLTLRVLVDGVPQHEGNRVLGDKRDTSFGLEVLSIQKDDGQFTIEPTSVVWYEN